MRLKASPLILGFFVLLCVLQSKLAVGYKTEIEITPAPPEEETTKKSGFFGGIKNFFRGSSSSTTTPLPPVTTPKIAGTNAAPPHPNPLAPQSTSAATNAGAAQKPPPLAIPHAPLVPLGPRPDTPSSSPFGGNPQQPPQWPQPQPGQSSMPGLRPQSPQTGGSSSSGMGPGADNSPQWPQQGQTPGLRPQSPQISAGPQIPTRSTPNPYLNAGGAGGFGAGSTRPGGAAPSLPPGFAPYHPPKAPPSGFDLSYGGTGGGFGAGGHPQGGRPGFGLAPMTSSTTTTTTTPKSVQPPNPMNVDMRGSFGVTSTTTTTPRSPTPKEEFPPLPSPRRPSTGAKEDFPPLQPPRSPSPTPASPLRPSSPSVWGSSTPTSAIRPVGPSSTPKTPSSPMGGAGTPGVSFVPHAPTGPHTSTARPGASGQSTDNGNSLATDEEIRALTETLYTKEQSLLNLVQVNPQGKTRSIDSTDEAPLPLLDIDPKALEGSTVAKMRLLFNNYEDDTLTNEHVTPNEKKEENDFVDAVMSTAVMRQAMLFLQNKGIVSPDPKTHRDLVKELWFTQYSRGSGKIGSSGFEHVFVYEVKNNSILIGLHNWVYFGEEEKAGHLDYKGYLNKVDLGNKAKILKVRFSQKGVNKPVNGLFIGTTPELELALYTVCFKLRPDRSCHVSLGNTQFDIVTYTWRYRGKHLIGSAFPEI